MTANRGGGDMSGTRIDLEREHYPMKSGETVVVLNHGEKLAIIETEGGRMDMSV